MKNIKKIITQANETKSWFFESIKLISLQCDSSKEAKRRFKSIKSEMNDEK